MRMRTGLVLALSLVAVGVPAQLPLVTFAGIPTWADSALRAAGLGSRFRFSSDLNPQYAYGDFDRDGLLDLAIEIMDTGGLRCGLAIVHRIDKSVHLVGAGQPVGNGKDQFDCFANWGVQRGGTGHFGGADVLFIADHGTRAGFVVWDGKAYVWVS
jgi:hypothetical protein